MALHGSGRSCLQTDLCYNVSRYWVHGHARQISPNTTLHYVLMIHYLARLTWTYMPFVLFNAEHCEAYLRPLPTFDCCWIKLQYLQVSAAKGSDAISLIHAPASSVTCGTGTTVNQRQKGRIECCSQPDTSLSQRLGCAKARSCPLLCHGHIIDLGSL